MGSTKKITGEGDKLYFIDNWNKAIQFIEAQFGQSPLP